MTQLVLVFASVSNVNNKYYRELNWNFNENNYLHFGYLNNPLPTRHFRELQLLNFTAKILFQNHITVDNKNVVPEITK